MINNYMQICITIIKILTPIGIMLGVIFCMLHIFLKKDPQRFYDYSQKFTIKQLAEFRCEYGHFTRCKSKVEEIDHFIPWSIGGATTVKNAVGACTRHNQRKKAKIPLFMYFIIKIRRKKYNKTSPGELYLIHILSE
jgi:hypothetical protein